MVFVPVIAIVLMICGVRHIPAYQCTFEGCERTFSVLSNMRRHARTHTQSGQAPADVSEEEESPSDSSTQPSGTGSKGRRTSSQ